MSFAALTAVRAARDIERFRTVVARSGTPGTVIDLHVDRSAVTYTVDFTPACACGSRIRLTGLTDIDIQADQQESPDRPTPSPTVSQPATPEAPPPAIRGVSPTDVLHGRDLGMITGRCRDKRPSAGQLTATKLEITP